jgi:hypothetical protein
MDDWCRYNVPGFRGVINRHEFPAKYRTMKGGDSVIMNIDPDWSQGGTHWVAVRLSSEAPLVFYKDSFGAPPPEDLRGITGRGVLYGNNIGQRIRETNCGRRAAEWLAHLAHAGGRHRELETFQEMEDRGHGLGSG